MDYRRGHFPGRESSLGLGILGIAAFYLGHILSDYSWFRLVSLAVASGRRLMALGYKEA